ncbi:hypothetical protein WGC32_03675 [Zongyangia sp. HA2173]|uniref:hypothetical protein n=1 Tax=Zongyangia sp. HA2173 TaxID=3133035 RepID=UPI0031617E88
MNIIIRHQAIATKIVTQIGAGWKIDAGRASATSKHRGDNFIANFQGFTSSIRFNIFAHFDDFASTLMTQYNWNITKRIILVLMSVSATDTYTFDFNKHLIVIDFGNIIFLNLKLSLCH